MNKKPKLNDLILNPSNPRLVLLKEFVDEPYECFLYRDIEKQNILNLLKDVVKEERFMILHMILQKDSENKGKLLILDGNRRVFVLKLLLDEEFLNKIKNKYFDFYQKVERIINNKPGIRQIISNFYEKFNFQIEEETSDVKGLLERIHSNEKSGVSQLPWGVWETKISNKNEPFVLFIKERFSELGIIFLLLKKDNSGDAPFKYSIARSIFRSKKALEWLHIYETEEKTWKSSLPKITDDKLVFLLVNFFKKKFIFNDFYNVNKTNETLAPIIVDFNSKFKNLNRNKLINDLKDIFYEKNVSFNQTNETLSEIKKQKTKKPVLFPLFQEFFDENSEHKKSKVYILWNDMKILYGNKKYKIVFSLCLRSFLEFFFNFYIEKKGLLKKAGIHNLNIFLKQKIELIINELEDMNIAKSSYKSLRGLYHKLNSDSNLTSNKITYNEIDELNTILHSDDILTKNDIDNWVSKIKKIIDSFILILTKTKRN